MNIIDSSSARHHGQTYATGFVTDVLQSGDGDGSALAIDLSPTGFDFTLEVRVFFEAGDSGVILALYADGNGIEVHSRDNGAGLTLLAASGNISEPHGSPNGWVSITIVYEGGSFSLYANGALLGTLAQPWNGDALADLYLGGTGQQDAFTGTLDDVRLVSEALPPGLCQQYPSTRIRVAARR